MLGRQRKKFKLAQEAFNDDDYSIAEEILLGLEKDGPLPGEAWSLLYDSLCYQAKWKDVEDLLTRSMCGRESFIELYIRKVDIASALVEAEKAIQEYPEDIENTVLIGQLFYQDGLWSEFLNLLKRLEIPGFNQNLHFAQVHAQIKSDLLVAIFYMDLAIAESPDVEELKRIRDEYTQRLYGLRLARGKRILAGEELGDAITELEEATKLNQKSLPAQEYYLIALTSKRWMPFRWFVLKDNPLRSQTPIILRIIAYAIFFGFCAYYYRHGKAHLVVDFVEPMIWIFGTIVIIRYTLFPLGVQLQAIKYFPDYHLFKRPIEFVTGCMIVIAWAGLLYVSKITNAAGFEYAQTLGLLQFPLLFYFSRTLENRFERALFAGLVVVCIMISMLTFYRVLGDQYVIFTFGSFLIIAVLSMVYSFANKLFLRIRETSAVQGGEYYLAWVHLVSTLLSFVFIGLALQKEGLYIQYKPIFASLALLSINIFTMTYSSKLKPNILEALKTKPLFLSLTLTLTCAMLYCGWHMSQYPINTPFVKQPSLMIDFVGMIVSFISLLLVGSNYIKEKSPFDFS